MGAWLLYERVVCRDDLVGRLTNPFCYILLMASAVLNALGSSQDSTSNTLCLFLGNSGLSFAAMLGLLNTERHLKQVLGTEWKKPSYRFKNFLVQARATKSLGLLLGACWSSQLVMSFYPSRLTLFALEDSSFKCQCITMLVFILICAASLVVNLSYS